MTKNTNREFESLVAEIQKERVIFGIITYVFETLDKNNMGKDVFATIIRDLLAPSFLYQEFNEEQIKEFMEELTKNVIKRVRTSAAALEITK